MTVLRLTKSRAHSAGMVRGCMAEASGQWHGPISTKKEAVKVAREIGRRMVSNCGKCRPLVENHYTVYGNHTVDMLRDYGRDSHQYCQV